MKRLSYLFIFILFLSSCFDGKYDGMRTGLDSLNMLNKADSPFSVEDVEPFVTYFNDHGTPNDQMLAYYLLGRAYHEQHETPMALQCYQKALEQCDTSLTDCDYGQLSKVWGQMADIYYDQGLYREGLSYDQLAVEYAWRANDTLVALRNYELEGFAYDNLGLKDSATMIFKDVSKKYKQYGYLTESATASGSLIGHLVEKGNCLEAKSCIDRYESESGRFDTSGNIEAGREIYYYYKGLYYLCMNALDSAEFLFRKELHDGKDFNNQHAGAIGLALLYQQQHQPDSTAKYYQFAYKMSDSIYAKTKTQEVERIRAMYDYSRHQEIAQKEKDNTNMANRRLFVSLIIILVVSLAVSWLYFARKELIKKLEESVAELRQINKENAELKQNMSSNRQLILENEKRIKQLELKLGRYGKLVYFGMAKAENNLLLSPNYLNIQKKAQRGERLQENDWEIVRQLTNEYFPNFYDFMTYSLKHDSTEQQICLLLRLHFKAGEIANLLGVTPPYISKICSEAMEELFKRKGSSKELAKELVKLF